MSTAPHLATSTPEVCVTLWVGQFFEFTGTAEQLIAEGLIPSGLAWPDADRDVRWEANGMDYWLCRRRPEGHKGGKSSWITLDNWRVRVSRACRDPQEPIRRYLERKAAELRAEEHGLLTPEGQRAWVEQSHRYWESKKDAAFQAFKAKVPSLAVAGCGRKAGTRGSQGLANEGGGL